MSAAFTGAIQGRILTVSGAVGGMPLAVGQLVTGASVIFGTTITALGTGEGGAGTYVVFPGQVALSSIMSASPALAPAVVPAPPQAPLPYTPYAYSAPTTGATVAVAAGTTGLIIDPATEIATLTVTLPPGTTDGFIFQLSTSQAIDALTVSGQSGANVNNGSLILGANGNAQWKWRLSNATWYAWG